MQAIKNMQTPSAPHKRVPNEPLIAILDCRGYDNADGDVIDGLLDDFRSPHAAHDPGPYAEDVRFFHYPTNSVTIMKRGRRREVSKNGQERVINMLRRAFDCIAIGYCIFCSCKQGRQRSVLPAAQILAACFDYPYDLLSRLLPISHPNFPHQHGSRLRERDEYHWHRMLPLITVEISKAWGSPSSKGFIRKNASDFWSSEAASLGTQPRVS